MRRSVRGPGRLTYYRATVGFAYRTVKPGKVELAIKDATLLIDDTRLQQSPQHAWLLAAAYYVRGLAYERQGDRAQAALDYQAAIKLRTDYSLAIRALERLHRDT